MRYVFILFFILSCATEYQEPLYIKPSIFGKWIEINKPQNTITFDSNTVKQTGWPLASGNDVTYYIDGNIIKCYYHNVVGGGWDSSRAEILKLTSSDLVLYIGLKDLKFRR